MRKRTVLRVFERLLREAESKWAEETPDEALGAVAFGEERPKEMGVSKEPDTEEETEVFRSLRDHMVDDTPMSPRAVAVLRDLVSRGKYPATLAEPPPHSLVHRGMAVSSEWLAQAIGRDPDELEDSGKLEVSVTLAPRGKRTVTSWSTSRGSASQFSATKTATPELDVSLLVTARAGDNPGVLLALPREVYDLKGIYGSAYPSEAEVIALGPVTAFRVEWYRAPRR